MTITNTSCINNETPTFESERSLTEQRETIPSPQVMEKMSFSEHVHMFWQFFFADNDRVPNKELPQQKVNVTEMFSNTSSGLKVSWLGHSSLLINMDGQTIITDPIFERKVSLMGPTRFNKELPLLVQDIPKVDIVIISHNHYDHLNKYSIKQLKEKVKHFLVPSGVDQKLIDWGIPSEKITQMHWGQKFSAGQLQIIATPTQHFSGRGLFDRNETETASWVIGNNNHRIFFSGDTGYFDGFKKIGNQYGPFDITFLECGAYDKRWGQIHMLPEQTVQAHIDLKGKVLNPIHWATFNLALHPWYEPMERLVTESEKRHIDISTPVTGATVSLTDINEHEYWWRPFM